MGLSAPLLPRKLQDPHRPGDRLLPAHRPVHHLHCRGTWTRGRNLAPARTQLVSVDAIPSFCVSDRATRTSPRRLPRWLTRSPTPPWTSTHPIEPSTSSSRASDREDPAPSPAVPGSQHLAFPQQRERHFLPNTFPVGNLRQSSAPFLRLTFPNQSYK